MFFAGPRPNENVTNIICTNKLKNNLDVYFQRRRFLKKQELPVACMFLSV